LGDIGYGFAYRVLDAQWFGLAQRRKRVFIVGCLDNNFSAAKVLLEPEGCSRDTPPRRKAEQKVAGALAAGAHPSGFNGQDAYRGNIVANTVATKMRYGTEGSIPLIAPAITTESYYNGDPNYMVSTDDAYAFQENMRAELTLSNVAYPIKTPGGKPGQGYPAIVDPSESDNEGVRRLTPNECETLQGFPQDFTEGHADAVRYRMLGNAVAVPVVEWIARRIVAIK
jgi:DNA (cytosine-5)-methyltransferase 1